MKSRVEGIISSFLNFNGKTRSTGKRSRGRQLLLDANRILVVDDDPEMCTELGEYLGGKGYEVETTSDCVKALVLIHEFNYDILLLDYKMRGITGIDLLKMTRNLPSSTSVFFITGEPNLQNKLNEGHLTHKVDGWLNKPVNVTALIAMLENA